MTPERKAQIRQKARMRRIIKTLQELDDGGADLLTFLREQLARFDSKDHLRTAQPVFVVPGVKRMSPSECLIRAAALDAVSEQNKQKGQK